jgi:hypothetical protein
MTAHRVMKDLHVAATNRLLIVNDPGDTETITIDKNPAVVELVTATGETRTLADPAGAGIECTLVMKTDLGDCTVTTSSAYDQAGSTTITFNDANDSIKLYSILDGTDTYAWRVAGYDGVTGPTAEMATIDVDTLTVSSGATISGLVTNSATAAAIATTRVLTSADSGGIFSVAKTGVYTITLPTPAQGISFKFMVLDTGANVVTILADGAFCDGMLTEAGATPTAMTGTTLLLTSGQSVGDWVQYEGISSTQWLVTGSTLAADDITIS